MNTLTSIVYKPENASPDPVGYTRVPLQEARLIEGYGIEGDTKGGKAGRELNVMSAASVESLSGEGFSARPGQLGEQLIVTGIDVEALPEGACIQIGATARIEMIKLRTGCSRFEKYQDKTKQQAAGRLGMIARVATAGTIRVGDEVQRID